MNQPSTDHANIWQLRAHITVGVLGAVGAFLLATEHRAHLLGAVPFLILLVCPLAHMFMHHAHRHHNRAAGPSHGATGEKYSASQLEEEPRIGVLRTFVKLGLQEVVWVKVGHISIKA